MEQPPRRRRFLGDAQVRRMLECAAQGCKVCRSWRDRQTARPTRQADPGE